MRMLGVAEQARNLAISALRGAFSRIGQLLLAAERFRAEEDHAGFVQAERNGGHDPLVQRPTRQRQQRWRSLDSTGNVRMLTSEELAESPGDQGEARTPTTAGRARKEPAAEGRAPKRSASAASPPIPGYDDLSVASLRARLRGLNAGQVSQLADYERSHANRLDIVTMFERRIAKLVTSGD